MLLHAFKPAKMPLTASLAAAAQGLLLASVFRPLTETYGDGTSQWNKTASRRRRPEKTQEFNKERLITRDECKSTPNDERGRHLSA